MHLPEPIGLARCSAAGFEVVGLDMSRFRPATLFRLLRLAFRHRIEVIHWNFFPPLTNGYVWALSLLAPQVKHFITDHNSRLVVDGPPPAGKRLEGVRRLLLRRYARVVGVSQFVVDCLRQQNIWPPPDCRLHFINTDRFAPDPEAREAMRRDLEAEGRFVLLAVAYLIKAKGIDVAVRALAHLPGSVVLHVVGDGPESAALAALSETMGLQQRVRFLGLQSQVEPYMQAADAFVCPSLWAEAAGLVNIEAQACGLPVLGSRLGGIPEYVVDGQTGFLFPAGDAEALAHSVRRLLDERSRLGEMSRNARELAVSRFSVAARLDEYLALYRTTL
jgi:glycosyltransferase involved in cell wall biosynthesis